MKKLCWNQGVGYTGVWSCSLRELQLLGIILGTSICFASALKLSAQTQLALLVPLHDESDFALVKHKGCRCNNTTILFASFFRLLVTALGCKSYIHGLLF